MQGRLCHLVLFATTSRLVEVKIHVPSYGNLLMVRDVADGFRLNCVVIYGPTRVGALLKRMTTSWASISSPRSKGSLVRKKTLRAARYFSHHDSLSKLVEG